MEPLKFVPFTSSVHPGFWTTLTKVKLDQARLEEEPINITGTFTNSDPPGGGLPSRLSVEWNAFEPEVKGHWNTFPVKGFVVIKNTIESFKQEDKATFLRTAGQAVWSKVTSWQQSPDVLTSFTILMYADLKKFMFYYWFSFPSFTLPTNVGVTSTQTVDKVLSKLQLESLAKECRDFHDIYSLLHTKEDSVEFLPLTKLSADVMLVVRDPATNGNHPGWTVRNLLAALCRTHPALVKGAKVLCLRCFVKDGQVLVDHSLVIQLGVEGDLSPSPDMPGVVGWEKNEKQQLGPRLANMRASMDPTKLAESSVDLNLKLMKWRLVPDLDLDKVMEAKCLLLGSGTLGCGVARALLGWGVRHITFVDNGKVSYSNPVRQSLFTFKDCLDGGRPKAVAASERLAEIFPGVTSVGHQLSIPMPGHPVSPATEQSVREAFDKLSDLISSHNVIFLLMDSRESRWLPTLISAGYPDKIVINAALGFNSYLVMRHGVRTLSKTSSTPAGHGLVPGHQLGCYFCNDVVAPGDSTTDRTLDQQCTVTRPGASGMAASLAVELAVSCLVHPQGPGVPAVSSHGESTVDSESVLGSIPHSIRGWLHDFSQICPTGPVFHQCTACSPLVLELFAKDGFELIRKVGDNPQYLEDVTGLTLLKNDTDLMDGVIDLDDDESISSEMS